MKIKATFIILLCIIQTSFSFALDPVSAADGNQYAISTHLLSLTSNEIDKLELVTPKGTVFKIPEGSSHGLSSHIKKIKLGQQTVEFEANGRLLWNGQLERPGDSPIQHLSSPNLIILEGHKARIAQGTPIEYFEKTPDGLYALNTTPLEASPGITVEFVIRSRDDDSVEVAFHCILSVLTGREKLPSTNLDVGKPLELLKKETTGTGGFSLRQWFLFHMARAAKDSEGNTELLLILMRINRIQTSD